MLTRTDGDINDFDIYVMKKRIGKDLVTRVTILTDGEATALAGRDLTLELRHNTLSLAYQLAFTIENTNRIVFTWYGKTQEKTGSYTLTLWENKGKIGMTAIDIPYVELVSWTYAEVGNTGTVPSTESIDLGTSDLETSGRGYSAYECWLQAGHTGTMSEFLASLKGAKGDKGDPGEGMPAGGSTGQVLAKKSSADYDMEWADDSGMVDGYLYNGVFYEDAEHTTAITGREKVIYVNLGVEGRDLYMYSGSVYLRVSNSALTKEQADLLYAPKTHTHAFSDLTDVDMLTKAQMEDILNA